MGSQEVESKKAESWQWQVVELEMLQARASIKAVLVVPSHICKNYYQYEGDDDYYGNGTDGDNMIPIMKMIIT